MKFGKIYLVLFQVVVLQVLSVPVFAEDIEESFDTMLFAADKAVYYDNDLITIYGVIFEKQEPTVLIGIYDPFGNPAGFYFGDVDEDGYFSVDFPVKAGVNFKTEGTYSAVAFYANAKQTAFFDFVEFNDESENTLSEEPIQDSVPDTEEIDENTTDSSSYENTDGKNEDVSTVDENKKGTESTAYVEPSKNKSDNDQILKPANEKQSQIEIVESNEDLTPVEVELGLMLNEINLSCDTSEFEYEMLYYDGMGPAMTRLCKFEQAVNYYNRELGKEPTNIETLTNKGTALSKLGLYDDAIKQYDKVLKLNPTFIPALNNKANIYATMGNFDDAIVLYNQVLQMDPANISANKNLGKINEKNYLYDKETSTTTLVIEEIEKTTEEKLQSKETISNYQDKNNKKSDEFLDHINNMFSYITKVFSDVF